MQLDKPVVFTPSAAPSGDPEQVPVPDQAPEEVPSDSPPETPPDAPVEIPDEMPEQTSANAASNGYWIRDGIGPSRYVPPPGTIRGPGPNGLGVKAAFGPNTFSSKAPAAGLDDGAGSGPTPGTLPAPSETISSPPDSPSALDRDPSQRPFQQVRSSAIKPNFLWAGAGMAGLALAYALLRKRRNHTPHPHDSAPSRAARDGFGPDKAVSAAVTIRAASDEVARALTSDPRLASAIAGTPGAPMNPIEHGAETGVWSWHSERGDTLVKLRIRPVRDGSLTAVTGIVAQQGWRVGAKLGEVMGTKPISRLRRVLIEARMRIETGQVAIATAPRPSSKV